MKDPRKKDKKITRKQRKKERKKERNFKTRERAQQNGEELRNGGTEGTIIPLWTPATPAVNKPFVAAAGG